MMGKVSPGLLLLLVFISAPGSPLARQTPGHTQAPQCPEEADPKKENTTDSEPRPA